MHVSATFLVADPSGMSGLGGDPAVEGHSPFQRNERSVQNVMSRKKVGRS